MSARAHFQYTRATTQPAGAFNGSIEAGRRPPASAHSKVVSQGAVLPEGDDAHRKLRSMSASEVGASAEESALP